MGAGAPAPPHVTLCRNGPGPAALELAVMFAFIDSWRCAGCATGSRFPAQRVFVFHDLFHHHFAAGFRQRAGEQNCEQVALGVSSQKATGCAIALDHPTMPLAMTTSSRGHIISVLRSLAAQCKLQFALTAPCPLVIYLACSHAAAAGFCKSPSGHKVPCEPSPPTQSRGRICRRVCGRDAGCSPLSRTEQSIAELGSRL